MKSTALSRLSILAAIAGLLALSGTIQQFAAGQTTTATITGTVTDTSGAVIANTDIELRNIGTAASRTLKTDASGRYTAPDLEPGQYEAQASKVGFSTELRKGILLTVGSSSVVDFSLKVGQQAETVTVSAEAAQVDTTSAAITNLVTQQQVSELPLNGRNFQQLILLAPGTNVGQTQTSTLFGKGDMYTISGARPEGMSMMLDGTDIIDYYQHGTGAAILGTSLGIDAIAEFQTLTNTYGAQFGGNGGVINAVSKSGTNTFHGSAYEFLRNSDLDARNFFDGAAPPPFRRNQFGGSIGGPIRKDKAFFFFNYEGLRQSLGITNIAQVPDANARLGILGASRIRSQRSSSKFWGFSRPPRKPPSRESYPSRRWHPRQPPRTTIWDGSITPFQTRIHYSSRPFQTAASWPTHSPGPSSHYGRIWKRVRTCS